MPEYVNVHVGGYGTSVGDATWQLYCKEHCIQPDGTRLSILNDDSLSSFFNETSSNCYRPKAVFVDSDPADYYKIRVGKYGELYDKHCAQCCSSIDTVKSVNEWYAYVQQSMFPEIIENIRNETERCDRLGAFLITNSSKGLSGSTLSTQLLVDLSDEYGSVPRFTFTDYANGRIDGLSAYYSCVYQARTIQYTTCSFCLDFDAINDFYENRYSIKELTMSHANKLIAQSVSAITMLERLSHHGNGELCHLTRKLNLDTRLHYPVLMFSADNNNRIASWEMTRRVFRPGSCLCSLNIESGDILACNLRYRGLIKRREVIDDLRKIKKLPPYNQYVRQACINVDYLPNEPVLIDKNDFDSMTCSLLMACHTTAIKDLWRKLATSTQTMLKKKHFVHYFDDAFETEISNAVEEVLRLADDYAEVEQLDELAKPAQSIGDDDEMVRR